MAMVYGGVSNKVPLSVVIDLLDSRMRGNDGPSPLPPPRGREIVVAGFHRTQSILLRTG